MVVPLIIALGLGGGFAYMVSQLIQPLSILVGIGATVSMWWWINQRDAIDLVDDPVMNWLLEGGLAALFGFLAYRMVGAALAALGFGLGLLIVAAFIAGGPALFVWLGNAALAYLLGE